MGSIRAAVAAPSGRSLFGGGAGTPDSISSAAGIGGTAGVALAALGGAGIASVASFGGAAGVANAARLGGAAGFAYAGSSVAWRTANGVAADLGRSAGGKFCGADGETTGLSQRALWRAWRRASLRFRWTVACEVYDADAVSPASGSDAFCPGANDRPANDGFVDVDPADF